MTIKDVAATCKLSETAVRRAISEGELPAAKRTGPVWRVRWRDEQGRARSRVVGRKADALALDNDLKRAKRLGGGAIVANHRETLAEFSKLWWARRWSRSRVRPGTPRR